MTRFDLDMDGSMEPCEDGQWVRYEDTLAQPEQEPVTPEDTVSNRRAICEDPGSTIAIMQRMQRTINRLKSQPEQEPVALYAIIPTFYVRDVNGTYIEDNPLSYYATPTQRKPLTDEQIKGIYEDCDAPTGGQFILAFARAIEAAHGIKE